MYKPLSLLIIAATLTTSCGKSSSNNPKPTTPTILLTKVTNNISGDPNIGKPVYEFTYNGKQLTKAVIHRYPATDVETDLFSYDSNSHLTGTIISHTVSNTYDEAKSVVSYSGDNISEIKFYKANNVLDQDITLTYNNGKLTRWFNPNEVSIDYTYDANGNNTSQSAVEYQSGSPDGYTYKVTNTGFDNNSNLTTALPFWIYFRAYIEDEFMSYTPGAHNPLSVDGSAWTYQYNSNGYPSAISFVGADPESYTYQYTTVN